MNGSLLAQLFFLSLLDMLNPSAIGVTIYLLLTSSRYHAHILSYTAGMFCAYSSVGVVLMLGLGSVQEALQSPVAYAAQGVIGAALYIYSWLMPKKGHTTSGIRLPQSFAMPTLFVLGITVTFIELVTAVPYLSAITLMTRAGLTITQWLPLLVLYDLLFITPPIALMAVYGIADRALAPAYEQLSRWITQQARESLSWLIAAFGFLLMLDASLYFMSRWWSFPYR